MPFFGATRPSGFGMPLQQMQGEPMVAGGPPTPPPPFPFSPGLAQPRDNGDGTFSTEVTRTVRTADGWMNVPSLWQGPGKPVDLTPMSDDQLAAFADKYEKATGHKFIRFMSEQEAVAAAKQRSNEGGAGSPNSRFADEMR